MWSACALSSSGCRGDDSMRRCCRCIPPSLRCCRAVGCGRVPRTRSPPSTSLLLALLAAPSQSGSWCGVVGMPRARRRGGRGAGGRSLPARADPRSRFALARRDGDRSPRCCRWSPCVPGGRAIRRRGLASGRAAARSRCGAARAGAVAAGRGVLEVGDPVWTGVGRGHGYLAGREVTRHGVEPALAACRAGGRMLLPDVDGGARRRPRTEPSAPSPTSPLEAVG